MLNQNMTDSNSKTQPNLTETVLQMLRLGTKKPEIISTLEQMNLTNEQAEEVYRVTKDKYDKEQEQARAEDVTRELRKKEKEILDYIDKEIKNAKKDLALQSDLKFIEQKKHIDKMIEDQKTKLDALDSELFAFKMDENYKIEQLTSDLNALRMRGSIKNLVSVGIIITGIVMIMYALGTLIELSKIGSSIMPFVIQLVLAILGAILIKVGTDIYLVGKIRTFKEYGLDWLAPKKEEEA